MEPNKTEKQTVASSGVNVATIFIILAIAAVAVAVVFWGISLGRKYQASSIEKKLSSTQEEINGMGDVDTKAKEIFAAEQNINNINASKSYLSVLLAELSAVTTKNVTLSQLTSDEEGGSITITGGTVSYEALAKFMTSLRNSGKFNDVVLGSATLTAEGSSAPITFSVNVTPNGSALSKNN